MKAEKAVKARALYALYALFAFSCLLRTGLWQLTNLSRV